MWLFMPYKQPNTCAPCRATDASLRPIDLFRNSVQPVVHAPNTSPLSVELSQRSWMLLPSDVQLLTRPDGSEWCLGRGAYGEVFRGVMGGTIPVAVKYLLAQVGSQQSVAQAIIKEITLLREARNNNIVQFYGACLREDCMMIVTEFMKGGDLYNALHGRSNGEQWLWRARCVCGR